MEEEIVIPVVTGYLNFLSKDAKYFYLDDALARIRDGNSKVTIEELRGVTSELSDARKENKEWCVLNASLLTQTEPKDIKKTKVAIRELEVSDSIIFPLRDRVAKLKDSLVCILFSGTFSQRSDNYLITHSGYIILDMDKVDSPMTYRNIMFENLQYIRAAWISPSGNGVKLLVRITPNKEEHRGRFEGLKAVIPGIDPSGINESRICYESYDPGILIREEEDTELFEGWDTPSESANAYSDTPKGLNTKTNYATLQIIVNMIRGAIDGQRNATLLRACRLAGGYISKGDLTEQDAIDVITKEAKAIFGAGFENEEHTIMNGINYGKAKPLHELEAEMLVSEESHSVYNIFDYSDSLFHQFNHGVDRGSYTNFDAIDAKGAWSRKRGRIAVFAAPPEYGKSEFMKQLHLLEAIHFGKKTVVYSPEETAEEYYWSLLHTLIGREPSVKTVTPALFKRGMEFIREHIFYVYPKTAHSVELIFANFTFMANKMRVDNFVIDPVTKLSQISKTPIHVFLGEFYTKCDFFAREFDCNIDVGVHPNSDLTLNKSGEVPALHFFNLAGGMATSSNVHDLLVLDRPYRNANPHAPEVDLYFRKIKNRKIIGNGATTQLIFDSISNRHISPNTGKSRISDWMKEEQGALFPDTSFTAVSTLHKIATDSADQIISDFEKQPSTAVPEKVSLYGPDGELIF
jgi:hypothetical protein